MTASKNEKGKRKKLGSGGGTSRLLVIRCLAGLAVAAGIAPAAVRGQDCKLSVQATPPVVYEGQSASVSVLAHFPTPPAPGGAYAFASAEFDVHATDPMWTWATAGAIAGSDVLGIFASQAHSPQTGVFANPSNPLRVWRGVFEPQSSAPALVEIAADPTSFSVYPSKLTSSSAECEAEGGSGLILVNPLPVGRWVAAPADGTAIHIADDVVVDGRIITGEGYNSARIGLLPTGLPNLKASSSRVEFIGDTITFTVTITGVDATGVPVGKYQVILDQSPDAGGGPGYVGGAQFHMSDGSVRGVRFDAFMGGVYVASGDFDGGGNGGIPGLVVMSLPQTVEVRSEGALQNLAGTNTWAGPILLSSTYGRGVFALRYDQPVVAVVRGAHGQPQTVTLDRIELHAVGGSAARISSANNLKQIGLGCHVFEASGVEHMLITPGQGE